MDSKTWLRGIVLGFYCLALLASLGVGTILGEEAGAISSAQISACEVKAGQVSLPCYLTDGEEVKWIIREDGTVVSEAFNESEGCSLLLVSSKKFRGTEQATLEQNEEGWEVVITSTRTVGGFRVTRRIFIPYREGESFARFREVLENPSEWRQENIKVSLKCQLASPLKDTSKLETLITPAGYPEDWEEADSFVAVILGPDSFEADLEALPWELLLGDAERQPGGEPLWRCNLKKLETLEPDDPKAWHVVETDKGNTAAQAGRIKHKQCTVLQLILPTHSGAVRASSKVSSEPYDTLQFYIDDELQKYWHGQSEEWTLQEFPIKAGQHKFVWAYVKSAHDKGDTGSDTAWIDNVLLPLRPGFLWVLFSESPIPTVQIVKPASVGRHGDFWEVNFVIPHIDAKGTTVIMHFMAQSWEMEKEATSLAQALATFSGTAYAFLRLGPFVSGSEIGDHFWPSWQHCPRPGNCLPLEKQYQLSRVEQICLQVEKSMQAQVAANFPPQLIEFKGSEFQEELGDFCFEVRDPDAEAAGNEGQVIPCDRLSGWVPTVVPTGSPKVVEACFYFNPWAFRELSPSKSYYFRATTSEGVHFDSPIWKR